MAQQAAAPEPDGANELDMFRDSAAKYTTGTNHVARARNLRGTHPGFDRNIWHELADLGWLGLLLPEQYGGLGLGHAEMAVVTEAAGGSLFPEPLVSTTVFAGGVLLRGNNEALKSELLPAMAQGRLIPALAWCDEGQAGDVLAAATRAEVTAAGARLTGSKRLIMGGAAADGYVVTARDAGGLGVYWIPRADLKTPEECTELADGRLAASLKLDSIVVPRHNCIAHGPAAENVLVGAYDLALIATAAELLGVLSRAFDITLDYLRTRSQFGKAIGSFQALQHRAVDLYIEQRLCRHALNDVTKAASVPGLAAATRGALASRIKARCSDAALRITREAIQMHGAIGFADECDIGLYLKRAITLAGWLGGADFHRRRYAALAPHPAQQTQIKDARR